MAGRRFDVADVVEVLRQWEGGRSDRRIARSLGMGRNRVAAITARAREAGWHRGGPPAPPATWAERVREVFGERVEGRVGDQERRLAERHEAIKERVALSTVTTVWQRMRDEEGLDVGLSTFRRYVRKHVGVVTEADITVRKELTDPGEIAEVDYGRLGMWEDPVSGRRRVVNGFVMVLAFSRRVFVWPVFACDQLAWVDCHRRAFEFFGGVPHLVRLDNLKTGVIKPDLYDPQINRTYAELSAHYGFLIDPCRVRKPKDKPRVERGVPYCRDSYWSGRSWASECEMQERALEWAATVPDRRPHLTLEGTVGEVFAEHERPRLLSLPAEAFEMARWERATLHPDCRIQLGTRFFSAPWQNVGAELDVRVGERVVRIYRGGELLRTHLLERGRRSYVDPADYPPGKIAFLQRTPVWCRREANRLGPHVAVLVGQMLPDRAPLHQLREAQGIIRLEESYPAERIDAACRIALDADGRLRTVRTLLKNGTDQRHDEEAPPPPGGGIAAGGLLHGPTALLGGAS